MFTQIHYVEVAKVINKNIQKADKVGIFSKQAVVSVAVDFAKLFAKDNAKFDVMKFKSACGI
jgi:hypothetical protein